MPGFTCVARDTIHMLAKRPEIREAIVAGEYRTGKRYWDNRARGLGRELTTCAEEKLLGYPGKRYYGESILVHDFSRAIHGALRQVDPRLWDEVHNMNC